MYVFKDTPTLKIEKKSFRTGHSLFPGCAGLRSRLFYPSIFTVAAFSSPPTAPPTTPSSRVTPDWRWRAAPTPPYSSPWWRPRCFTRRPRRPRASWTPPGRRWSGGGPTEKIVLKNPHCDTLLSCPKVLLRVFVRSK